MADIPFTELVLTDPTDDVTVVDTGLDSLEENPTVEGEVRRFANGRFRSIRRTGTQRELSIELQFVTRADVDQLREWIGTLLLLRDPYGRKVYGVYYELDVSDLTMEERADVSFDFTEVSYDEEV